MESIATHQSKVIIAEGKIETVGHLKAVQPAILEVREAGIYDRHLTPKYSQRVQGDKCCVPVPCKNYPAICAVELVLTRTKQAGSWSLVG